jgi:hypothetical protein
MVVLNGKNATSLLQTARVSTFRRRTNKRRTGYEVRRSFFPQRAHDTFVMGKPNGRPSLQYDGSRVCDSQQRSAIKRKKITLEGSPLGFFPVRGMIQGKPA